LPGDEDSERLRRLEAKIAAAKAKPEERPHTETHYSQANLAWRMVTELVAGLGIGFAIGLGLDALLGTTPFLMIVFLGLGLAAGVNVMMRTAREVQTGPPPGQEGEGAQRDAPADGANGTGTADRNAAGEDGTGGRLLGEGRKTEGGHDGDRG